MQPTRLDRAPRRGLTFGRSASALVLFLTGVGPAASGCGSSENHTKAGVASSCSLNSECTSPLVCTSGKCHVACNSNGDCARDEHCVQTGGSNVCQFSNEGLCAFTSECPPGLFCATDSRCRNQCQTDRDCLTGLVCTPSHACADPTELGANGDLMGAAGGKDAGVPNNGAGGQTGGKGGADGQGGGPPRFDAGGPPVNTGGFNGQGGTGTGTGGNGNPSCGAINQPCCGLSCNDSAAICSQQNHFCVACGAPGQSCCQNDVCSSGATCAQNLCTACGGLSQPCCGGSCTSGLECASGVCDVHCDPPFVAAGGQCTLPPPRLVSPSSGSFSNTRLPKVSLNLPSGVSTAFIQFCADRDCATIIEQAAVSGSTYTVASPLPRGVVYFRARSDVGADAGIPLYSATWEMVIGGAHDAPHFAPWGTMPDFNGDGHADVIANVNTTQGQNTRLYPGAAGSLVTTPVTVSTEPTPPGSAIPVGDFNGDGFTDLMINGGPGFEIYRGSANGLPAVPSQQFGASGFGGDRGSAVGDVDADGFADIVIASSQDDGQGNQFLVLSTFRGGFPDMKTTAVVTNTSILHNDGGITACDVNGDSYTDIVVSNAASGNQASIAMFFGGPTGLTHGGTDIQISLTGAPMLGVSCVGDVDGDGYDDVAATDMNSIRLYRGGTNGLVTPAGTSYVSQLPTGAAHAPTLNIGIGDFDGDGYSDYFTSTGNTIPGITVFTGGPSGAQVGVTIPPPQNFTVQSGQVQALSAVGDVDGDGLPEFGVSVSWTSTTSLKNNELYVFKGGAANSTTPMATLPINVQGLR